MKKIKKIFLASSFMGWKLEGEVRGHDLMIGLLDYQDYGKIRICGAGQSGIEIEVQGILDPKRVKVIIDKYRKV